MLRMKALRAGVMMNIHIQHRSCVVILSAAKDLTGRERRSLLSIPRIDGRNRFARCAQDDRTSIRMAIPALVVKVYNRAATHIRRSGKI